MKCKEVREWAKAHFKGDRKELALLACQEIQRTKNPQKIRFNLENRILVMRWGLDNKFKMPSNLDE